MAQSQLGPSHAAPEFGSGRLYSAVLTHWPRILLAAIVGALLGIAFSLVVPAQYQATAELSIGIDYSRIELLDEDAERYLLLRVQDLLLSDQVLQGAIERLPVNSIVATSLSEPSTLRERIRLTHIEARWMLSVTHSDSALAAAMSNAWAQSALMTLEDSQAHAWRAAELQVEFFEIACRPGDGGLWVCDEFDPESSSTSLPDEVLEEVRASRGISPAISYSLLREAVTSDQPVTSARAAMAIASALLGLLLGFGLVIARSQPAVGEGQMRRQQSSSPLAPTDESEGR